MNTAVPDIEFLSHVLTVMGLVTGMAVGYGMLKANVRQIEKQLDEHREEEIEARKEIHKRFVLVEKEVNDAGKLLEGLRVSVESIDSRTNRIDEKIDKLLER